jgi:nucleoside 2-deoxyribosyltransferase
MESMADFESWRDKITIGLKRLGIICLDPTKETFCNTSAESMDVRDKLIKMRESGIDGDYEKVQKVMTAIVRKDLRLVDISDFIICFLTPESPTYGTTHELVNAAMDKKPILFVMRDWKKVPLWLLRYVNKKDIFPDIDSILNYLSDINDNKIVLDEAKWKLLKLEYR